MLGGLWLRWQREDGAASAPEPAPGDPVVPDTPPPPVRTAGAPWLTISLRPVRAGLNLITAAADCEITLTNEGEVSAEAVRTALTLLSAQGGQAEVARAGAAPIGRSVVPPFTLAPGEARTFRGVASANLTTLQPMQAGGRDMLVPLVLVRVQHRDSDEIEHRTLQGFVVGVERVDSPKLAPFWLDTTRMVEQVAARPSGAPERGRVGYGPAGPSTL